MPPTWIPAYVALGSNLDEPRRQVLDAYGRLGALPETQVVCRSRLYLTAPMGPQGQPNFVNAVAALLTQLTAADMLAGLLQIERDMGRVRAERWGPRRIDLDLLWMTGRVIDDASLTLPHPGVSARNFVLYPLLEIAPDLELPGMGRIQGLKSQVGEDGISLLE